MATDPAPTGVRRQYRKMLFVTPVVGAVGGLAAFLFGHPLAGAMFCIGLALGLGNSKLVIMAATRYAAVENAGKGPFVVGSLKRLGAITLVAFVLAYVFRPDGLAVIAGLAVFQMVMMAGSAGPLLREVRNG